MPRDPDHRPLTTNIGIPTVSTATPDEADATSRAVEWRAFLGVALQVGAALLLAYALRIESPAFHRRLLPLIAIGFVVHHALPMRFRLRAFAALSIGSVFLIFGLTSGLWIVGIGLALLGVCHLPVPFTARVALLLLVGGGLAALRAGAFAAPFSGAIWPILGSMFMYRLVVYMYDLRHATERPDVARALAYFFCVPNVVFPLFPVVDYATFRRTWFDRPAVQIYQQGVAWIVRGCTHLALYRLVYQHVSISPADVGSTADLIRYLIANFALYLRVSGQFHLIVGVLHLFGFRLPETHRFFYLASSFTDFWRRINIYWKDFMQKVVFNPTFYGLKPRGETFALVIGTLTVFAATWFFHSYQWFWILGTWLLSWTDTAFWAILGVILVFASLREMKVGRARSIGTRRLSTREAWQLAFNTTLTFTIICVLWGMWTSPTFADFFALFDNLTMRPLDVVALAAVPLIIGGGAVVAARYRSGIPKPVNWRANAMAMAPLFAVWGLAQQPITVRLGPDVAQVIQSARSSELSRRDADQLQRGYYERLVGVNRFNGQLWEVFARAGEGDAPGALRAGDRTGVVRQRPDELQTEMVPDFKGDVSGAPFATNRWGMRDRDYEPVAPPGTWRIAVLGQSYVAGAGVADDQTFENLVERALQSDTTLPRRNREVLNFAVVGYSLPQQLLLLQRGRLAPFSPQVLLLVGHPIDLLFTTRWVQFETVEGREVADDFVAKRVRAAGLRQDMALSEMQKRIGPYRADIVRWALQGIVTEAKKAGMIPVFAFIPTPHVRYGEEDVATLQRLVRETGFEVIDLADVYDGHDPKTLIVSESDRHPNAEGHRIIAERLTAALRARPHLLGQ